MKKIFFFFLILLCKESYPQWNLLSSGYANLQISDITETPSGKILAVGTAVNGATYTPVVFKSYDNGASWDTIHVPPGGYFFQTIGFLTENLGYIGVGGGAYILQTTDSGNTWTYVYQNPGGTAINDIEIIDTSNAVACGFGPVFYGSGAAYQLTGQTNWSIIPQSFPNTTLDDLQMLDSLQGYALSLFGKKIFHTINGGTSWNLVDSFPTIVEKMFWWNRNSGIAVGFNAHYYRTTNGGFNWTSDSITGYSDELTGVAFLDTVEGFACAAGGRIFRTMDGGETWTAEPFITSSDFYNLELHRGHLYAVGADGTIARFENPSGLQSVEQNPGVKTFPDPANETVQIEADAFIESIEIKDIQGRSYFFDPHSHCSVCSLDTKNLPEGIYLMQLNCRQKTVTQKLIVQH